MWKKYCLFWAANGIFHTLAGLTSTGKEISLGFPSGPLVTLKNSLSFPVYLNSVHNRLSKEQWEWFSVKVNILTNYSFYLNLQGSLSLSLFSKVTFSRSPGAWLHTLGFCVCPCVWLPAWQPVPPPLLPHQAALREGWKVNTFFIFLNRRIRAGPAPCWCSLLVLVVRWFIKWALTPCCSATQSCLFATPWTAARQSSLSFTISWSLLKLMCVESVMPSNHLILGCPLLLLASVFV